MKVQRFQTIYIGLLIAAATITVISLFEGKVIDIHLHDTMFVISPAPVFGLFFLFISLLYLANRWLIKISREANIFLWIVLITTWVMWGMMAYHNLMGSSPPARYLDASSFQSWTIYNLWIERIFVAVSVLFFFLQIAFWLYFIAMIISKLVRKKSQLPV